jgi:UDP-N-acetyl-D-mannosaminuronic acid transferase (WecB/TagA/CpsF family)
MQPSDEFRTILGLNFFVGSVDSLISKTREGGLIVVPAAPALVDLPDNASYRRAVENARFAITDSGFLVLLWLVRKGELLERISGLRFLRALLDNEDFRSPNASFWIMPSAVDSVANLRWLQERGLGVTEQNCYVAPLYWGGGIKDGELLKILEILRPRFVVINIGGGTQEVLGDYLQRNLSYRPAIICTGAAIAFLSGQQVNIPPWADRMMLGWLARCLNEPRKFVPRYWRALRFTLLMLRYAETRVPAGPMAKK